MKHTWRHWINGKGYYSFKSFKVYWAYREHLTELFTSTFKPSGFELFLIDNGFKQTVGKPKEFSTYDNCGRGYTDEYGNTCTIGLMGSPCKIAITWPIIKINNKYLNSYPTPDLFDEILKEIQKFK